MAQITLVVTDNMDISANFRLQAKDLAYHEPENNPELGFELTYLFDVVDVTTNAETGKAEYLIQNYYFKENNTFDGKISAYCLKKPNLMPRNKGQSQQHSKFLCRFACGIPLIRKHIIK